ncbi:hypothetical protein [Spirillospora sp. NPDC047279]|uniref:hypothetical protein n=1 Tax=Spirillospora sp. NPDC047279 TaxID=3155478 RepID=UPI00340E5E11
MTNSMTAAEESRVNMRILLTSTALIGAGTLIGLTGVVLGGSALLAGARRKIRQMDVAPRELARQKLLQAKHATSAGVDAWQHGPNEVREGQPVS